MSAGFDHPVNLVVEDLLAAPSQSVFVCALNVSMCAGFDHPVNLVVEDLLAALDDPALPLLQWGDRFSAAAARLPARLADQLEVRQENGEQ